MGITCFAALFRSTSRELTKLNTLLSLTLARLPRLHNLRLSRCAQAQADVAHLLLIGDLDGALFHVERVIKERNMIVVLIMVENYCHVLTDCSFLFHEHRECPEELLEVVAGLSFAAPLCGDLPELRDIRRIFLSKFGKEFIIAVTDQCNNCGVSSELVQNFSTRKPSLEMMAKVTKEIANEHGIKVELAVPNIEMHELLGDAQEKLKVVASVILIASKFAAEAAAAAQVAMELFQSELERRDHSNLDQLKESNNTDDCSP